MNEEATENVTNIDVRDSRVPTLSLPETIAGLMDMKKSKNKQGLNDQVDVIHQQCWIDAAYRDCLDAVHPEMAVEGSLIADDFEAARMIRDMAKDIGNGYIAGQKLDTIRKALMVVLRRYGISRKERRDS